MAYPLVNLMKEELDKAGLVGSDIDTLVGIIEGSFGTEWFDFHEKNKEDIPVTEQHPIFIGIKGGSFMNLAEVLDLSTSLLSFKGDTAIANLLSSLKITSSYGDTAFQLAMAYRFKRLGFNVVLEPTIDNGMSADFSAEYGDIRFIAECTVLREWSVREEERKVFFECYRKLSKLYKRGATQIILSIVTKSSLSFDSLPNLQKDIMSAGTDFLNNKKPIHIVQRTHTISVVELDEDTRKALDEDAKAYYNSNPEWEEQMSFVSADAKIPGDISSIDLTSVRHGSLMRYKPETPPKVEHAYSLEDKIDKKISTKIRQLKSHPSDFVPILFIGVQDNIETIDWDRFRRRLANDTFKKVPNLGAIFITTIDWVPPGKHRHEGVGLMNDYTNSFSQHVFDAFNTFENDRDPVKEWRQNLSS